MHVCIIHMDRCGFKFTCHTEHAQHVSEHAHILGQCNKVLCLGSRVAVSRVFIISMTYCGLLEQVDYSC